MNAPVTSIGLGEGKGLIMVAKEMVEDRKLASTRARSKASSVVRAERSQSPADML